VARWWKPAPPIATAVILPVRSRVERGGSREPRGAGKQAVRQRDPTWALRCPAFPSLKYYSVRVEKGESPAERRQKSPTSPLLPYPQTVRTLVTPSGPPVTGVTRSYVPHQGIISLRGRNVLFFFPFRSFVCAVVARRKQESTSEQSNGVSIPTVKDDCSSRYEARRHYCQI